VSDTCEFKIYVVIFGCSLVSREKLLVLRKSVVKSLVILLLHKNKLKSSRMAVSLLS